MRLSDVAFAAFCWLFQLIVTLVTLTRVPLSSSSSCIVIDEEEEDKTTPPPEILSRSRRAAELIKDIFDSPPGGIACNRVVVLTGNPGTGKSLSVRMLVLMLDAVFTDAFNPGASKLSPTHLGHHVASKRTFVMVIEKFDGILKNIMTEKAPPQAAVKTKTDWNRMLDAWKRKQNGILVLTTNLDESQLLALCQDDTSFLTKGRVDLVIRFDEASEVTVVHDFFQNSKKEHVFTNTYLNDAYDDDDDQ